MANADSSVGNLGRAGVKRKCCHLASLPSHVKGIPNSHSPCISCRKDEDNCLCLDCKVVLCRRDEYSHILFHYHNANHAGLVLKYSDLSVWCYRCGLDAAQVNGIKMIVVQEGCNLSLEQRPIVADNDDVAISPEVLWEGHLVNESYVELLSEMKKAYPQTFEHLSLPTPVLYTSALNMLGEFHTLLASKLVAEMTIDEIMDFGDILGGLKSLRFNVGWLQEQLDLIKEMRFNSPLVYAYEQSLRSMKAKQKEIEEFKLVCTFNAFLVKEKFGFLGENVSTRFAADGLLAESPKTSSKSE